MAEKHMDYESCKTRLNKLLQSITSQIHTLFALLEDEHPNYTVHVDRLCELSQRKRFINGHKVTAALLVSASQEAYQSIVQIIKQLQTTQREIYSQVEEYEQEKYFIVQDLCQAEQPHRSLLSAHSDWSTWCKQVLSVLQTQINYLELHTHSLLPIFIKGETVKNIKDDVQISKHCRDKLFMSLAQIDRPTDLLRN